MHIMNLPVKIPDLYFMRIFIRKLSITSPPVVFSLCVCKFSNYLGNKTIIVDLVFLFY